MQLPVLPETLNRHLRDGSDMVRSTIVGLAWAPAVSVARSAILTTLSCIDTGTLLLVDEPGGTRHVFGQKLSSGADLSPTGTHERRACTTPRVEIVIKKETFWMRLFLFADIGFSEAYMLGDFICEDLTSFFQLFIINRDRMRNGTTVVSRISSSLSYLARSTNTLSNSLLNISAHYDISNDMFAAFLSSDMTYSCPVWQTRIDSGLGDESLEAAQQRKLTRFIEGAKLKATDHVLEIGTGWGSFAIEAVSKTGCRVTSITLSKEQKELAEARVRAVGLHERIEIMLTDYRQLPVPEKPYDKIVSIEMLEAVGQEYLGTYFDRVNRLLKPDGGIAMFQCITMPENRHEAYSKSVEYVFIMLEFHYACSHEVTLQHSFINQYIFPGGYLPSITQLLSHISEQSHGTLIIEKVENIGGHYAKTLRLWNENFQSHFDSQIKPALLHNHPGMTKDAIEVFRRKWEARNPDVVFSSRQFH
ncbi:methoxy mycolic acid synthase 1 [Metarhizium anisopliae]|nr:methoxy mycolic acid synthase 1 [Metarhizium anisopliae]